MSYAIAPSNGKEYLDNRTYIKNSCIHTTLYSKPSDTHVYLNPNSCHPKHVCTNIPTGVGKRLRKICSEVEEYKHHKEIHTTHFAQRGYNRDFVMEQFNKCDNLDRLDLIGDPEISFTIDGEDKGRRFPLVLDFHPSFAGASKAINKYKYLLDLDENLKKVLPKENLFVTFRKNKTIADSLVHSRYPWHRTNNNLQIRNINCGNCNLCKYFLSENTATVKSSSTNQIYNINQSISCTDEHVVYVISDLVCIRQSVGSTDITMRTRFSNHKSHIKKKVKSCRVAVHFNENSEHKFDIRNNDDYTATLALELKVILIDKVMPEPWDTPESITRKLIKKESYWQHQLKSFESDGGLNVRNERLIANKRANAFPMATV